jgi:hypothetical protein
MRMQLFVTYENCKYWKVLFYATLAVFRKAVAVWNVPRLRPFILLITAVCTYMEMNIEYWWNNKDWGRKRNNSEKTLSQCYFVRNKSHKDSARDWNRASAVTGQQRTASAMALAWWSDMCDFPWLLHQTVSIDSPNAHPFPPSHVTFYLISEIHLQTTTFNTTTLIRISPPIPTDTGTLRGWSSFWMLLDTKSWLIPRNIRIQYWRTKGTRQKIAGRSINTRYKCKESERDDATMGTETTAAT